MIEQSLGDLFSQNNYKYRPKLTVYTGNDLEALKLVYKVVKKKKTPIYTVNSRYNDYNKVRLLYQQRKIVKCFYGYSVNIKRATEFLKQDEPYLNPALYPSISTNGTILYYLNEFRGDVEGHPKVRFFTKNLLKELIPKSLNKHPLFVLDSPMGFYEFKSVVEDMGKRRFYVLFRGTDNVKHFRSLACVQHYSDSWDILGSDETWYLTRHRGCNRIKNFKKVCA